MKNTRFSGAAGTEYSLFRQACPHYDELQTTIATQVQASCAAQNSWSVLEIGCGPGYTTDAILRADARLIVTAIDSEPVMHRQAEACLSDYLAEERVSLVLADALGHLQGAPPRSYAAVASGFTLHNLDNRYRDDVLREIHRVLRPGGMFVNGDKYAQNDPSAHERDLEWQLTRFREVYGAIGRQDLADAWEAHYREDERPGTVMREAPALQTMRDIGFTDVRAVYRQRMEAVVTGRAPTPIPGTL